MAIAFGTWSNAAQGVAATSITTTGMTTTGSNLLVACCATYTPGLFTSVTDSKSNTWSNAAGPVNPAGSGEDEGRIQYSVPSTVGASHTFTLTISGADYPTLAVAQLSGADATPLDQTTAVGESSTTTTHTAGPTGTLAQADEAIVGMMAIHGGGALGVSDGSYTAGPENEGGAGENIATAYKVVAATTAVSVTSFTSANSVTVAKLIATFKAASAGGTRPVKMAGAWGGYAGTNGGFAG